MYSDFRMINRIQRNRCSSIAQQINQINWFFYVNQNHKGSSSVIVFRANDSNELIVLSE